MKTPQDQFRGGRCEGISLQHTELIGNSTGEHCLSNNSQLTSHSVTCHCAVTVSTSDGGDSSPGYIIQLMNLQSEEVGGGVIKVRGGVIKVGGGSSRYGVGSSR